MGSRKKNANHVRTAAGLLNIPANETETPQKSQLEGGNKILEVLEWIAFYEMEYCTGIIDLCVFSKYDLTELQLQYGTEGLQHDSMSQEGQQDMNSMYTPHTLLSH